MSSLKKIIENIAWEVRSDYMARRVDKGLKMPLSHLFDKEGIAFIHIPKTGGTSVSFGLYGEQIPHFTASQLKELYPKRYSKWSKFAIVREPISRFLSSVNYAKTGGINDFSKDINSFVNGFHDINKFVKAFLNHRTISPISNIHFWPQIDFITHEDGDFLVDYILNFSRLELDMKKALSLDVSLPRLNSSQEKFFSRQDLSPDSIAILKEVYKKDFEALKLVENSLYHVTD